ncbi:MAG: hypothetical protein Kow0069_25120 [Promethearchaeota archaeon]
MKVHVVYFGPFRELTSVSEEVHELPSPASLGDLLNDVIDAHGERMREQLFGNEGEFHEHVNVLVNGRESRSLGALDAPLSDGDRVALLLTVGGG